MIDSPIDPQARADRAEAALAAMTAERDALRENLNGREGIDTRISLAHMPEDGICPATEGPVEDCDTCHVLTAYAQRQQRWHWNLIREQVMQNRAEKAEAALAAEREKHEALSQPHECEGQHQLGALVRAVGQTPPPDVAQRLRAEGARAVIDAVEAVCAEVEADNEESLNTCGQHLFGAVIRVAEMVREAVAQIERSES